MKKIENGTHIAVHYTGTLEDGNVFDSSEGHDPLKFTVGKGSIIEGFDEAVLGKVNGDEISVKIAPDKAYGERDEKMVMEIDREDFNVDEQPEIGMQVGVRLQDGRGMMGTVVAITPKKITLDLNHPLAGKTLNFTIKVIDVREPGEPGTEEWEGDDHDCCGDHSCSSCDSCDGHEH